MAVSCGGVVLQPVAGAEVAEALAAYWFSTERMPAGTRCVLMAPPAV